MLAETSAKSREKAQILQFLLTWYADTAPRRKQ
jgi:hypothetical protein